MSHSLEQSILDSAEKISQQLQSGFKLQVRESGQVLQIGSGIARVSGLPHTQAMELLHFENNTQGIAFSLDDNDIGVILLGDDQDLSAGSQVERTGRVIDIPVGNALKGRIINALGQALDDKAPIMTDQRWPVERPAPDIIDRAPVSQPLQTGIKIIDALIPIGRGQRQLILGDRQTGKTAIAIDTILNQQDKNMVCIYCAVGQRNSAVAKVMAQLKQHHALDYTVAVVASGDHAPGLQFIAPYAATSIAEWFMSQGQDALIIYDDLTRHAHAYRELSLLLRRPPGREAYPGDIFYLHSRLLERACRLKPEFGGSLTALPMIETQAQNLSDYIPTNLISITDGQVYLSPILFQKGNLPAVDAGKSVSRVGGKAQLAAYRDIVGPLRLSYAQFEELETFARFGTRLDDNTRQQIEHGKRVREIFKQPESHAFTAFDQNIQLMALNAGLLDNIPLESINLTAEKLCRVASKHAELQPLIASGRPLSAEQKQQILTSLQQYLDAPS